jgi:hypothetical protein
MKLRISHATNSLPKLFLFAASLFAGVNCLAQITNIAVAPNKLNVLYIGVDNPVSIAAAGAADDKVSVSISGGGGSVTKQGIGNYIVRVSEVTNNCLIQVNVDGKPAGSSTFRVRTLPAPSATVGGFFSGASVPLASFIKQAGLGLYLQDFPFEVKYEVVNYTLTFNDAKVDIREAYCQGSEFTEGAKNSIKEYLKPGSTVTIDRILAKDESGTERKIPSLVYYIK